VGITYGYILSKESKDLMLFITDNEGLIREGGGTDGGEMWGTTKSRRRGRWIGCWR
jgi:hypothetical protein